MKYAISALAALLVGCGQPTKDGGSKPESVETLIVGKHGDCTIYWTRTLMPASNITWVRCQTEPKVVETNHVETCGKSCTRHVKTITVDEVQR